MKKILVTGATGFIGESVIDALKNSDEDFKVFCLSLDKKKSLNDSRFIFFECDLLDIQSQEVLIKNIAPTHCIHLAWHVPPQEFWHSMKNIDWLYASAHLFKMFCRYGGKVFLGAGSIAEYDLSESELDEEKTQLLPSTLYGESKKALRSLLQHIQNQHSSETVLLWARIGYFFGEQQPRAKLLTRLFESINAQTPLLVSSKETSRPYAHVSYLGIALVKALFQVHFDMTFNISASNSYSIGEIVEKISSSLEKESSCIEYGAYQSPIAEPLNIKISTKKIEDVIDWKIPNTFINDISIFTQNLKKVL